MRYRIERVAPEDADPSFLVTVFPGPLGFEATPEEKKETRSFSFSEEGLDLICAYLNERYNASPETWHASSRLL